MSDLQQQIYELERQRLQAEQAERARLDAEKANQRTIEDADARIRDLQRLQRQADFAQAVEINKQLIEDNQRAINELFSALDDHAIERAIALVQKVDQTFSAQQLHSQRSLSMVAPDIDTEISREKALEQERRGFVTDSAAIIATKRAYARYEQQLEHALPSLYAIPSYIVGREGEARQIARGLCFCACGKLFDVPADYDARKAFEFNLAQQRRGF